MNKWMGIGRLSRDPEVRITQDGNTTVARFGIAVDRQRDKADFFNVTAFNKTYPLIRLATGDLSYIDRTPCSCGRTSPRLGSIVGRVDTTARIKGMFVYPHQVEQVMARFEEIKRWQIEVTNPGGVDEMVLYVEASNFKRKEELQHLFRERIKLRPELRVLTPGSLPPQIKPIEDKRVWD